MEYTDEQKKAILKRLEEFIATKPSQKQACIEMKISDGVISRFRNGEYTGDNEGIFRKLDEYFKVLDKKSTLKKSFSSAEYVPISISEEICDIINICQIKGRLAIICGDAGVGKTKAFTKYQKEHPSRCISITVNTCCTSVKSLLRLIAAQINAPMARSNDEIWWSIADKLADGMVLLVDEAQFLTFSQLEVLRSFSDYFENNGSTFGVTLLGNPELLNTMYSRKREYAQIINRCVTTKTYKTADILRSDIELLFPDIAENDKEIDFLWKIARTHQRFRGVSILYNTAFNMGDCSYEGLVSVAENCMNIDTRSKK